LFFENCPEQSEGQLPYIRIRSEQQENRRRNYGKKNFNLY